MMSSKGKKLTPYYFVAPYFIFYFLFSIFPFVFTFIISFTNWNGVNSPSFVGFANYIRIFTQDFTARKAFLNTFIFLLCAIPLQLFLGFVMAILIRDFAPKARGAFQLLNFLPYLTASVAVGLIFQFLFDWKFGTVNQLLALIKPEGEMIYWLGSSWAARVVVILVIVWRMCGYSMIIISDRKSVV
jgi:ABC-type sugar transport system permease subunit